jgi:hypothetical protein
MVVKSRARDGVDYLFSIIQGESRAEDGVHNCTNVADKTRARDGVNDCRDIAAKSTLRGGVYASAGIVGQSEATANINEPSQEQGVA